MTAIVLQGDARALPLPDESVDLIVTSPPYFGLRSYTDGGEHYAGQIGSESTPQAYLEALWACTAEWVRVLKPGGSMFINLGDKYAGSRMDGSSGWASAPLDHDPGKRKLGNLAASQGVLRTSSSLPQKSLLGIPWRYAIGCMGTGWPHQREEYIAALTDRVLDDELEQDEFWRLIRDYDARNTKPSGLGLILRAEIVWAKPNGLPESVTDRVRRAHEQVFHFTRQPRYYAAVDEIREPHTGPDVKHFGRIKTDHWQGDPAGMARPAGIVPAGQVREYNPLGKLPGSVWSIPSAPLQVPARLGVDHFAAFPPALVRPLVLGWSPPGVCTGCGEGRRPVVDKRLDVEKTWTRGRAGFIDLHDDGWREGTGLSTPVSVKGSQVATITGYACACPQPDAPTRPAIVLDPFGGTGTTALVASTHGRVGITVDRSADYCRLAQWRVHDPGERARARDMPKPPPIPDGMEPLFGMDIMGG